MREHLNFTVDEMHAGQIAEAVHYRMVIMGWGEDEGDESIPQYAHEVRADAESGTRLASDEVRQLKCCGEPCESSAADFHRRAL